MGPAHSDALPAAASELVIADAESCQFWLAIGWGVTAFETPVGLHVRGKPIMVGKGNTYDLIKTGLAVGATPNLSIGFTVPPGGSYTKSEDGHSVGHFKTCELKEWSVVIFGASPRGCEYSRQGSKKRAERSAGHQ